MSSLFWGFRPYQTYQEVIMWMYHEEVRRVARQAARELSCIFDMMGKENPTAEELKLQQALEEYLRVVGVGEG
jgi:hypothetical protein